MKDIAKLNPDDMVKKVRNITKNYTPRAVRRKEIPKLYDPSKTRPLGIPCIWDRLIQQCILQVLEPICEAKFSENSHGFRPNRSCEHAIAAARPTDLCNYHIYNMLLNLIFAVSSIMLTIQS
jgi:retron-type reverse transcriptase